MTKIGFLSSQQRGWLKFDLMNERNEYFLHVTIVVANSCLPHGRAGLLDGVEV